MNKIAPQDMRQHLMLNQSRLSTADEVAQEIEDYLDAPEDFSRDGLVKSRVKDGKPGGVQYNFGKSGTKARRKNAHPGKGNHNQDQAGSPNEATRQRTLGDFGIKRQRVEFAGDVQENDDFETPRVDRAALCVLSSKCARVSRCIRQNCQVRRREFFQVCRRVSSQKALMRNLISRRRWMSRRSTTC